ncbi:DUF3616 domain-containing protein [Methylobacterium sp. NMS12]|uniref:DUF3616 domain-containing protein n=1 Tax=Methylobacterium sp. NMS12 TaxID=3079766 RepID=UPI003F882FD4
MNSLKTRTDKRFSPRDDQDAIVSICKPGMMTSREANMFGKAGVVTAVLCGLILGTVGRALAQSEPVWRVENKLLGKPDAASGEFKKSKNVSGIACIEPNGFPRHCLVIDDEQQGAQIVILEDGRLIAGDRISLVSDTFKGEPLELDGEGVAFAAGSFYVVGSHGHPRDKKQKLDPKRDGDEISAKIQTSSRILRIPIGAEQIDAKGRLRRPAVADPPLLGLREALLAESKLRPWVDKRLESNGLTVEGLAIYDSRMFVGFRGPSIVATDSPPASARDRAAVLSFNLSAFQSGRISDARLHELPLGIGRGVRDLVSHENGLLVLAGPVSDPSDNRPVPFGAYAVYDWDGGSKLTCPYPLSGYSETGEPIKPEAMLSLDPIGVDLRLLVLFDGAEEGGARAIRVSPKCQPPD